MASTLSRPVEVVSILYDCLRNTSAQVLVLALGILIAIAFISLYLILLAIAPVPRQPYPSEKKYITSTPSGNATTPAPLPSWHDTWLDQHTKDIALSNEIEPAEVFMSVVIPAYNEEDRLEVMLEEAITYLDAEYGRHAQQVQEKLDVKKLNGNSPRRRGTKATWTKGAGGYEILLVNDGSKDKTVDVALRISHKHGLHDILRIVTLKENRGKGGAVIHGFRHVRGKYAIFADADGASTFSDLGKLVRGCEAVHDPLSRGVAVGSRAHMVGSEAVIKRSALRNALMHGFHLLLWLLTPPATSRIKDTQCGFKLFSRASLPYIVPYMHAEGWIFDVEMLMLAESAPSVASENAGEKQNDHREVVLDKKGSLRGIPGIKIAEVPIGWQEIGGSKLNVMWDSLGMAWGLALLRLSWAFGVYKRR